MAQSTVTIDRSIYQGTAAASGGTFNADYAVPTDKTAYLRATCIVSSASAGHQANTAVLVAEYVAQNKNGTVTAPAAITSSNNPSNSNTATFVASAAQVSDYAGGAPTLTWSVSGTNARATYTNNGIGSVVNVTIYVEVMIVGST